MECCKTTNPRAGPRNPRLLSGSVTHVHRFPTRPKFTKAYQRRRASGFAVGDRDPSFQRRRPVPKCLPVGSTGLSLSFSNPVVVVGVRRTVVGSLVGARRLARPRCFRRPCPANLPEAVELNGAMVCPMARAERSPPCPPFRRRRAGFDERLGGGTPHTLGRGG